MQPGTDRRTEGQTDGRVKGQTYRQKEVRTDTTKLIIFWHFYENTLICKRRKLDEIFEKLKMSRVVNLIATQVGLYS